MVGIMDDLDHLVIEEFKSILKSTGLDIVEIEERYHNERDQTILFPRGLWQPPFKSRREAVLEISKKIAEAMETYIDQYGAILRCRVASTIASLFNEQKNSKEGEKLDLYSIEIIGVHLLNIDYKDYGGLKKMLGDRKIMRETITKLYDEGTKKLNAGISPSTAVYYKDRRRAQEYIKKNLVQPRTA